MTFHVLLAAVVRRLSLLSLLYPMILLLFLLLISPPLVDSYEATWESLDKRPLPQWYNDAKFGIFIHWGVFSVPSFGNEWFWYQWKTAKVPSIVDYINKTQRPDFDYRDYANEFHATLYDPQEWSRLFARSGAQYVVLTSKHHEGFCNWDSSGSVPSTWNWNAMDVGPHRDLVADLSKSVKSTTSPYTNMSLKFGLYHSLLEWYNPAYLYDKQSNFTTTSFVDTKSLPELYDLVNKYEPEIIWSDGHWEASSKYWKGPEFLAWYATQSSVANTAVWNDRWGIDALCTHGSFLTCNDRYFPGKYVSKKWENALTVDARSWGWNRNATYETGEYLSTAYFVHTLIATVAFNGNMLLNVGPAADGTISPIFYDRLYGIGEWLNVNGRAIYATRPWIVCQNETTSTYYTRTNDTLYAIVTRWPYQNRLVLKTPVPTNATQVRMLGWRVGNDNDDNVDGKENDDKDTNNDATASLSLLSWKQRRIGGGSSSGGGLVIRVPALTPDLIPCQHAWVFALTNIANLNNNNDVDTEEKEEEKVD